MKKLSELHTRQLLNLKNDRSKILSRITEQDPDYVVYELEPGNVITLSEIKAELAKREHVPNKLEAKRARQERAKRGRHR